MKRTHAGALILCVSVLLLAGCAGPNPLVGSPGHGGVAGFWSGFGHGLICPIAFVISFFNDDVAIYEVHNSGHWYDAGFLIGAGAWGILRAGSNGRRR